LFGAEKMGAVVLKGGLIGPVVEFVAAVQALSPALHENTLP
jgi:hypothetical protein